MLRIHQSQLQVGLGLALLGCCARAPAAVINVPGDHATIQAAINAASNGDTVEIEDGTYTGSGNRNISLTKQIIVRSVSDDPTACVIDCESATRGIVISGSTSLANTVVRGLGIQNGSVSGSGAGVFFDSPATIENCYIEGCAATNGGGGIVIDADVQAKILSCVIRQNSAGAYGGGLWTLAGSGYATVVRDTKIAENWAGFRGGGVNCFGPNGSAYLDLFNCNIDDNVVGPDDEETTFGGGLYNAFGNVRMWNCTVRGNQLDFSEGGILDAAGAGVGTYAAAGFGSIEMVNCLITNNGSTEEWGVVKGGGIDNWGMPMQLINCTVAHNAATTSAAGINERGASTTTIENTIVFDNELAVVRENIQLNGGDVEFRNCCIQGGSAGIGGSVEPTVFDDCIVDDPDFVNAGSGDFELEYLSPCINNGDSSLLPDDDLDVDSDSNTGETLPLDLNDDPRQVNPDTCVDMGCFENQVEGTCLADITGPGGVPDGNIDVDDLLLVLNSWGTPGGVVDIAGGACGDADVNMDDLLAIINNWGTCLEGAEVPSKVTECMSACEEEPSPEEYAACVAACLEE